MLRFELGLRKQSYMESKGKKILIADDEPDILEIIGFHLKKEGYDIVTAKDGDDAFEKARLFKPDLVILDIMMPRKTGIQVCELMRTNPEFSNTYIFFLTALSDEQTHIKGLETGADDFVTKPISPRVLVSRVNAIFRRLNKPGEEIAANKKIVIENIVIDPEKFIVTVDDQEIILAKKEFELIYLLASRPGRVFLRNEILDKVWGSDVIVGDRTIDVHIRKIRQKMNMDCITTVKGVGYKFEI
jgi:two-component system alkaline phosphatase synthesis response regulator PhoP